MMLLAYNHARPTYTVTGGSLVTDAAALSDRSPASATRITWPSGSQTTATTCTITATFAEQPIRAVALLGTTLPDGLKIELRGKRTGDAGYTYDLGAASLTQTLVPRTDGGTGAVWAFPASNDPLIGVEIRLYNDVGGAVSLAASQAFDVGEIVVSDGAGFVIQADWTFGGKSPSATTRTLGSQISNVQRPGYRTLDVTPIFGDDDDARNGGLDNGADWQSLTAALRADPYVLAIVSTGTTTDIQTTSLYGIATRIPDIAHQPGHYYQPSQLTVEEIPA